MASARERQAKTDACLVPLCSCDACIEHQLAQFESRAQLPNSPRNLSSQLRRVCGVNLTKIPGLRSNQLKYDLRGRSGYDQTEYRKTVQLLPGFSSRELYLRRQNAGHSTCKVYNRAADALRLCAESLTHSKSALGQKYRRLKAKLGAPKAIIAMAHHLARLVYRVLRYEQSYVEKRHP